MVLLLAFFVASDALAQRRRTGGSFGGGSFGRSSRSSSSSSSGSRSWGSSSGSRSWGSSSRSSRRSRFDNDFDQGFGGTRRGYTGGGRGCGFGLGGGLCCFLMFAAFVVLAIVVARRKKGSSASGGGGSGSYSGPDAMYVSKLSLGIDWRARPEVQGALKRLAETGDTSSPEGLANLLRETVLALRRAEMSWLYIGHQNLGPLSPQDAEAQFNQLATSARSSFQHETVRAAGGQVHSQDGPDQQASSTDGEGTVVVHLLVAAYRPMQALDNPDADQIRSALDNRAALTADQLGALEVVWSPAAEDDRMSTAELEQFYPDLRLIDPNSIAGRIFCSYCRGPFAMELLNCPHCGAPAEASRENRAPPGAS